MPQPNSRSGGFLKLSCNVKSKDISVNFLYSVTVKSTGQSPSLNGSFTHDDFVTSCIGHWENKGSLRFSGSFKY